jgi:hypothetical protein
MSHHTSPATPRVRTIGLLGVALLATACAAGRRSAPAPESSPGAAPSAEELRRDLEIFSADSFRGRRTGTDDARRAAAFLAGRLAALGVEPAGDSGYFQRVPLVRQGPGPAARYEVRTAAGAAALAVGEALVPMPTPVGAELPADRAEGDVVFLGYASPATDASERELERIDVTGKVAVLVAGTPPGTRAPKGGESGSVAATGRRLQSLVARRPAAVVVLLGGDDAKSVTQLARQYARIAEAGDLTSAPPDSLRRLPMLLLGDIAKAGPLLPEGWPADARPRPLDGRRFVGESDMTVTAFNVVGVVRGRDPVLRATYVAYGAHYDHIGVQQPASVQGSEAGASPTDSIANGADDDGTGSVTLLALARAFQEGPRPRRSVLFVWHVGEEQGLLGSEHFAAHPTVPLDSIVAQLNADMIGRNAPDSLYVVGPRAAPRGQSKRLGAVLDSVNATLHPPFAIAREWDSPTHPEQIYYRSDHYSYARRGVPIVFLTTGLHEDYHRVSDESSKIDYDKLARVGRLLLELGRAVGDAEERPK